MTHLMKGTGLIDQGGMTSLVDGPRLTDLLRQPHAPGGMDAVRFQEQEGAWVEAIAKANKVMQYSWMLDDLMSSPTMMHVLCMAQTQSRKTELICEAVLTAINSQVRFRRPMTPILLLSSDTSAFMQFRTRWHEFQNRYGYTEGGIMTCGEPTLASGMSDNDFGSAFMRRGRGIIPCLLANPSQSNRLRSWLDRKWDKERHGEFVIVSDEADQNIPNMVNELSKPTRSTDQADRRRHESAMSRLVEEMDRKNLYVPENQRHGPGKTDVAMTRLGRTKTENELDPCFRKAAAILEVTATGMPCLSGESVTHVFGMKPNPPPGTTYMGYKDITYVPVPTRRTGRTWTAQADHEALDMIFRGNDLRCRIDIGVQAHVKGILHEPQARILVKCGQTIREHKDALRWCLEQDFRPMTVIEFNEDTIKLHMPRNHPLHGKEPITFPCKTSRAAPHAYTIPEVTQLLKDENARDPSLHSHVVYVSGRKADRGISFVSEDYGWHLTHMYYVGSLTSVVHAIIQSCGRLNGCFKGSPRLVLFSDNTTLTDYFCTNQAHERILETAIREALPEDKVEGDNGTLIRHVRKDLVLEMTGNQISTSRSWASGGRARRLAVNVTLKGNSRSHANEERILEGLPTMLRRNPEAMMLDHMVTLEGRLPDDTLRDLFDVIHLRGPAAVGEHATSHVAALSAMPPREGNCTSRMDEILKQVSDLAHHDLDMESRFYLDLMGPATADMFRFPEWAVIDPRIEGGMRVDQLMGQADGTSRYRASRFLTKGRTRTSNGGEIDYLRHTCFLVCPTPPAQIQKRFVRPQDMEWDPSWKVGLLLRLARNEDIRFHNESRGHDEKGKERLSRTITGPVIYSSSERSLLLRRMHEGKYQLVAFAKRQDGGYVMDGLVKDRKQHVGKA